MSIKHYQKALKRQYQFGEELVKNGVFIYKTAPLSVSFAYSVIYDVNNKLMNNLPKLCDLSK
jgi:hypothetical protein